MHARSPLREATSAMVSEASRWNHTIRRESAEEIPGHLPAGLRKRGLAGGMERVKERLSILDRSGSPNLPCRQSSHESFCLLGMGNWRDKERAWRCAFFGGGFYQTSCD